MYQLTKFGLVLTVVALSYWPASILAGPTVLYKDHVSGTGIIMPTPDPTIFTVAINGSGVGTYMGKFQLAGQHTLQFTSKTGGTVVGNAIFTAADGSTALAKYTGTFTQDVTGGRQLILKAVSQGQTGRQAGVIVIVPVFTVNVTTTPNGTTLFAYDSIGTLTFP